jgi:flagella basal body P-ring formation protein FlgA
MRLIHALTAGALAAFAINALPAHAQTSVDAPAVIAVPVLDHPVSKGDVLSASDFVTRDMPSEQARGVPRVRDVAGMEALRALPAGAIVRATDLIRPQLVRRGEPVTIALRDRGLSITTAGRALASGAAGDFVRVVNLSTNRTIDGVVEASGLVRVSAQ